MKHVPIVVLFAILNSQRAVAEAPVSAVPVPRAVIYGGDVISEVALTEKSLSVIEIERANAARTRGELVGRVARRTLLPGQPIAASATKAADVVKRGQPVTAIIQSDGLLISGIVVPLQSGAPGEMLSFQNSESGLILRGTVQEDGTVRVGP